MRETVMDYIIQYAINERVDRYLLESQEYVELQEQIQDFLEEIDGWRLSNEKYTVVEGLVEKLVSQGTVFAKIAYELGFKDSASILKYMELFTETNFEE